MGFGWYWLYDEFLLSEYCQLTCPAGRDVHACSLTTLVQLHQLLLVCTVIKLADSPHVCSPSHRPNRSNRANRNESPRNQYFTNLILCALFRRCYYTLANFSIWPYLGVLHDNRTAIVCFVAQKKKIVHNATHLTIAGTKREAKHHGKQIRNSQ